MNKTPKIYSRPSLRRHRKYRVQMTFPVSVNIKLKINVPDVIENKIKRDSSRKPKQNTNKIIYMKIKNTKKSVRN